MLKPRYGIYGSIGPAYGFKWEEVRCTDGSLPLDRKMRLRYVRQARNLNRLRKQIAKMYRVKFSDVAISVNSWYRSRAYNTQIGGALHSEHVEGRATDIRVYAGRFGQVTPPTVAAVATKIKVFREGGIGHYDSNHGYFTHVDHRPNGPARWIN